MADRLIPYTVYLPEEHYERIRDFAKQRKASEMVRDAICSYLDGTSKFDAGYNRALKDAARKVKTDGEMKSIAINNETLSQKVAALLSDMEK